MTPYWKSLEDFLAMGGYGLYVWGSFGVTALAMAVELYALRRRRKALASEDIE
jgi:heme exporter protein D